jgi:hypothetical protein
MAKITLIGHPEYLLRGIECPYCKAQSLSIFATDDDPAISRYYMQCVNSVCVTNFMTQTTTEVEIATYQSQQPDTSVPKREARREYNYKAILLNG